MLSDNVFWIHLAKTTIIIVIQKTNKPGKKNQSYAKNWQLINFLMLMKNSIAMRFFYSRYSFTCPNDSFNTNSWRINFLGKLMDSKGWVFICVWIYVGFESWERYCKKERIIGIMNSLPLMRCSNSFLFACFVLLGWFGFFFFLLDYWKDWIIYYIFQIENFRPQQKS